MNIFTFWLRSMYDNNNNDKEGERMKRTFTSLFIFLLLLSSCSTQANDHLPERNEPSRKMKEEIPVDFFPQVYKIVAIGDSLTQGVGDSTKRGGYIPYLQEYLEAEKGI